MIASVVVVAGVVTTGPVAADHDGHPEYLEVDKTVSNAAPAPGETFTYTIDVRCSEEACVNATLTDPLPPELEGFPIQSVATNPGPTTPPTFEITWAEGGDEVGQPAAVGPATQIDVTFLHQLAGADVGLPQGASFTLTIVLQAPSDLPPGTIGPVTNSASTAADNSAPDSSSADVTIVVPVELGVEPTKTWTPTPQAFQPGAPSQIQLGATNASSLAVDDIVIQEPSTAPDGASTLDASNPFTITDFTGFGDVSPPDGATAIQVDAYVFDPVEGVWGWVSGAPNTPPTAAVLPAGVGADAVGGLRISFIGDIAIDESATVELDLEQRATDRDSDDTLATQSHTVDNVALATVTDGDDSVDATATATYTVNPPNVEVGVSKDIQPDRISAGDAATATLTATNNSDIGVEELRISDLDFFTEEVTFGGFSAPIPWPATATSAEVIYHTLTGTPPTLAPVPFAHNTTPAGPSEDISGFEIVFTGADGSIDPTAGTQVVFTIDTTEDATDPDDEVVETNTVTAEVTTPSGLTDMGTDSDDLVLVRPFLNVELDKTILPNVPVEPGDNVVAGLQASLSTSSDYVTATEIMVEDAWDGTEGDFWDAFELSAIAPTQVPAGTTLTVEVQTAVGTWVTLTVYGPDPGPTVFSMNTAQIVAALAPTAIGDVTGVRFTFDNPDGFPAATVVEPYVVSEARNDLRTGGPTAVPSDPPVAVGYDNHAVATVAGETEAGTELDDDDGASDGADIHAWLTPPGTGGVAIDKEWNEASVPAQSGELRSTRLDWRVSAGFETVTITDPANAADPANSVFEAFDLFAIEPVPLSDTPFTNGWYLKYDTITAVELYSTTAGDWQSVDPPTGGWIGTDGFVGHTLDEAQRADTTGVRIVLAENGQARDDARDSGNDPFAPEAGSGVGFGAAARQFSFTWQLRNAMRPEVTPPNWATGSDEYNVAGSPGTVRNTVQLTGDPIGAGAAVTDGAFDDIQIIDFPPLVEVAKTATPDESVYVPFPGTDPDDYPTASFAVTANNGSVSRASYVRVTDPACSDTAITACQGAATAAGAVADPFDSGTDWLALPTTPFDRFDLRSVTIGASIPAEVDLGASVVWLLRYDPVTSTYSTTDHPATDVNAMAPAALADVVGVSVTFQGSDPATTGGTITAANDLTVQFETRLRPTIRSNGAVQDLGANQTVTVSNRAFAQSYDPVLSEGTGTGDDAADSVVLDGGVINVDPTKAVSPTQIVEPERDAEVTVTLGANQGASPVSSLSPAVVWLRDDIDSSPDFWDAFELTGLGPINAPAGADRVQIDVHGPSGWQDGTPTALGAAEPPVDAAQYPDVTGIRFTFSRDDGAFFSPSLPAPNWSTTAAFTAVLRDAYRGSGDAIAFPSSVANTVTVQSDRLRPNEASEEKRTDQQIDLLIGSHEVSVDKLANNGNRSVNAGDNVPWRLAFSNTGTGFLTITELRDTLPPTLVHLGEPAPVYLADPDGTLSDDVSFAQDGQDLVFTWPDGGNVMQPGETFEIEIHLELQPGLGADDRAENTMTVRTEQTLDGCSHLAQGAVTDAWDDDPTTCGTTDYVQTSPGASMFTRKGVRGELDGATNPGTGAECQPALTGADSTTYFRSPCAAHSTIGGVDNWILQLINSGTVDVDEMIVFDQLPVAGDLLLLSGASRGSVYRPQVVDGSLAVNAPDGTDIVVEVSQSSDVCAGTWSVVLTQEPCEQNGETWEEADGGTDWSLVTGLRVRLDFSDTTPGALSPGQRVEITFDTVNVPATGDDPSGAPSDVPATDSYAWNQFGVKYLNSGAAGYSRLAPAAVGVHLRFGSIEIVKQVTGPGSSYAPGAFVVDVECSIDDDDLAGTVELDLGVDAVVTLDGANGFRHRIDGVPVGASCTLAERGDVGQYGETSRTGSPVTIDVDEPTGLDDDVPIAQIASITNDYQVGNLAVTKEAVHGSPSATYTFAITCVHTSPEGETIDVPLLSGTSPFTLQAGETAQFTVLSGSRCTVVESPVPAGATVTFAESGSAPDGEHDGVINVVDSAELTVTNTFDAPPPTTTTTVPDVSPPTTTVPDVSPPTTTVPDVSPPTVPSVSPTTPTSSPTVPVGVLPSTGSGTPAAASMLAFAAALAGLMLVRLSRRDATARRR